MSYTGANLFSVLHDLDEDTPKKSAPAKEQPKKAPAAKPQAQTTQKKGKKNTPLMIERNTC